MCCINLNGKFLYRIGSRLQLKQFEITKLHIFFFVGIQTRRAQLRVPLNHNIGSQTAFASGTLLSGRYRQLLGKILVWNHSFLQDFWVYIQNRWSLWKLRKNAWPLSQYSWQLTAIDSWQLLGKILVWNHSFLQDFWVYIQNRSSLWKLRKKCMTIITIQKSRREKSYHTNILLNSWLWV